MKRDRAVFLVQSRFGGMDGEEDRIVSEMQLAQETYERSVKRPWFLVTDGERDIGTDGYTTLEGLEPKFLLEYEPKAVWLTRDDGTITPLQKLSYDAAMVQYGHSGAPKYYDIIGDILYAFPIPDKVYRLRIRYYGRDLLLDSDIENKFLRHAADLLIACTCEGIAKYAEPPMVEVFRRDRLEAEARLQIENDARQTANLDMKLGDDF